MTESNYKSGFVAIVGAPNAGKSTLLNRILKLKVAIVTDKPQTTRHRILGVHTTSEYQAIFWDTPGVHKARELLNKKMVAQSAKALEEAELALWVVDSSFQGSEHAVTADLIKNRHSSQPLLIALNKTDLVEQSVIEELKAFLTKEYQPLSITAISAQNGTGIKKLLARLGKALPKGPVLYPEDTITDQPERLIAAEMIREAVFKLTSQELPYSTAVTLDEFIEEPEIFRLSATVHVERDSQKSIVIGRGGQMLKQIGTQARLEIERMTGMPVFLKLFVRVTKNWTKNARHINEFGYGDA